MGILDKINCAEQVKQLNIFEMASLAKEIRSEILSVADKNGGHLSSNLGVVEATIALYHVFDFPTDKLIFDVGHQCYTHKILSGRKDKFDTIRTGDGLSGFPDKQESEFDPFTAGHAGTSIADGLGVCYARDKLGEDYNVVSFVGDGSFVNGLNLEALSSSNVKPNNFIVILNDNGMGISSNKNGLYQILSKGTTKRSYLSSKRLIRRVFGNSFITKGLAKFRNFIKRILNKNNYFENHGFKYVGVVDGNNIKDMVKILQRIKNVAKDKAVLLHIKTTKGKGYEQAEMRSDVYHGVGKHLTQDSGDFSLALGEKLNSVIEKNNKVVALTAGMKDGTGLSIVEQVHPKNFVDVGIAEEFAVTIAGGMAQGGLKPFVCIYSTFLQRAYDQIIHDVCLQNLPVVFCIDRAGLVGRDGKTHQGVYDLSYLLHLPNITIFAPNTTSELCQEVDLAMEINGPVAIRYPKNTHTIESGIDVNQSAWRTVKKGQGVTLLAVGPAMLELALKVAEKFPSVSVVSVRRLKPLCERTLLDIKDSVVITLEENSEIGGFGSMVSLFYLKKGISVKQEVFGVRDEFISHDTRENQIEKNVLDEKSLSSAVKKYIK